MTKSTKHKKEFRKEKNKVKLKLSVKLEKTVRKNKGSLLPKGLNVTDTTFKTKKIIIPENLRPSEDSGIPLSNKRQTYKELLSHMGHFTTSIQHDGINGMKELLVKFPSVLEVNMGSLLNKLSELMSTRDTSVRKSTLKLMDYIIQSSTPEKILPFFPLLNAQLMSCMNHIALDIQKDSHLLMDILLTHVPGLVATVTMEILPNFLEQISCRDDSKAGKRVLTINPNQRLTSLKWRQEVLMRINRLLVLLLSKGKSEARSSNSVTFNPEQPCPLYLTRNFNLNLNFQKPGHFAVNERSSPCHQLQEFSAHLFPLLMETWVEALASEQLNKNQGSSLIGPESVALLTCISDVMFTLWSIMNQSENRTDLLKWFELQCGESLIKNFIERFPFAARIETSRTKKQSGDPFCREQNLVLCFLWAQLEMKSAAKYAASIFQYLSGLFQSADRNAFTQKELDQLKDILLTCCNKKALLGHVNNVIESAVEFSNRVRSDRKDRQILNRTLIDIGQKVGDREDLPALKCWIETCPAIIRDNANMELLEAVNRVMSRNQNCLINGQKEVAQLVANLEKLGSKFDHWKAVFDFIYLTKKGALEQDEILMTLQQHIGKLEDPALKSYGLGVLSIVGAKT